MQTEEELYKYNLKQKRKRQKLYEKTTEYNEYKHAVNLGLNKKQYSLKAKSHDQHRNKYVLVSQKNEEFQSLLDSSEINGTDITLIQLSTYPGNDLPTIGDIVDIVDGPLNGYKFTILKLIGRLRKNRLAVIQILKTK